MKWCHSFPDLGITGSNISGEDEEFILSAVPENLEGKSVLDLASFDGFYSFEALKRGAKFVVSLDNGMGEEILNGPDQGSGSESMSYPNYEERQKAFDRAYEKYKMFPKGVHLVPLNVEDMDKLIPDFDVIFCFGLYYHLTDIFGLFEKCFKKCKELLIVEGVVSENFCFLGKIELHSDPTSFWSPSLEGLGKILFRVGFKKVEVVGYRNQRILLKCWKT